MPEAMPMIEGNVVLLSTRDGAEFAAEARRQLAGEPITVTTDLVLPDPWDAAVIVVVLSHDALADLDIAEFLARARDSDLPIVPVVESLSTYRFSDIPPGLTVISDRNAVGLKDTDGPNLVETVRGHLGLEAFARSKKVFISYRRSDAKEIATLLYDYLWSEHFQVFVDTRQIEGGAEVQKEIIGQIEDKDFVLLLDSPDAGSSRWVQEEVVQALARRIPVCAVSIGTHDGLPLARGLKRVSWDPPDPQNLERVRLLVSRGIASKESLDARVLRAINAASVSKGIEVAEVDRRALILVRNKMRVLIEYEDAAISLERLHRLYRGYKDRKTHTAVHVSGDPIIQQVTLDAVSWARGRARLEAVPLPYLYLTICNIFA
jgi:hypothetical protein